MGDKQNPVDIAKAAIEHARNNGYNVVILDTAGRLHVDESMMEELAKHQSSCGCISDNTGRRCHDRTGRCECGRYLQPEGWH